MAYNFNGTSQYLSRSASFITTPPLTISCKARVFGTGNHALCGIGKTGSSERTNLQIVNLGSGSFARAQDINAAGTGSNADSVGGSILINTWYTITGVFTSSTLRQVYINDVLGGTNTASNIPTGLNTVLVGARGMNPPGLFLTGNVAEVGIWNVALTADEIASLAKGMTPDKIRPQNLAFYAPLVRELVDTKTNLTITNNNGATVANHPRVYK